MVQDQNQTDIMLAFTDILNRLRAQEAKLALFSERLLIMNQNMLEEHKHVTQDLAMTRQSMEELQKNINTLKTVVHHLTDEAKNFAREEEVKMLEKYLLLWNPLHFVTEKDVNAMINAAFHETAIEEEKPSLANMLRKNA